MKLFTLLATLAVALAGFFAVLFAPPPRLTRAANAATAQFDNLWRTFRIGVAQATLRALATLDPLFRGAPVTGLALVERDAVAKVQDLSSEFANVESRKYPFTSAVHKGAPPDNAMLEYAVEKYDTPNTNGAIDEADPVEYENPSSGDAMLYARVQTWERAARIGGHAVTFTKQAGITPRNVVAKKIAKKLVELKGDIELTLLSDNESQVETGGVANKTRGLGKWATNSAQTHYAVDSNYRPPSDSFLTTAVADFTDETIINPMKSSYDNAHGDPEAAITIWAGSTWKQTLGRFTFYSRNVSNMTAVRHFQQGPGDKIRMGKVDMLETDFGNAVVRLSRFINASGDHTTAASKRLAIGVLDEMVETRWAAQPYSEKLAKTGRNEKFLVTATGALALKNPKSLMAWRPSA